MQVSFISLNEVEKFKYLGVAFTSDGRQDEELDVWSGKASAVMQTLHHSVVLKRELSRKQKFRCLSQYSSSSSPMVMNLGLWLKGCDHKCKRPKWDFCEKSMVLWCLTNIVTLQFENLSTSSCYFSGSKDFSLDDLAMLAECLGNGFSSTLNMLKWMGRSQLEDHEQDSMIISW